MIVYELCIIHFLDLLLVKYVFKCDIDLIYVSYAR